MSLVPVQERLDSLDVAGVVALQLEDRGVREPLVME